MLPPMGGHSDYTVTGSKLETFPPWSAARLSASSNYLTFFIFTL